MIWRLVLFLAFLGAVLYVAPQLAPATTSPASTARPAAIPAAVASGLDSVDSALRLAVQTGKSVPVTIRMTDADLTLAAQPYFPQNYAGITVADPNVRIGPALTLTAKASSLVLSGPLVASATPYASDGKLALRLDAATVGGIALPDAARTQLQAQLQSALNSAMPAKLQVSAVLIAQGFATISGSALP